MSSTSPDNSRWKRLGAIALVGHRGAGKSTLGPRAADILGRPFVDLDQAIAERSGRAISSWVEDDLAAFRHQEAQVFSDLCERGDAPIIACGAGIAHLDPRATVVWLDRQDWRDEVRRSERPRVRPELSEEAEWQWMERTREPRWQRAAHLRLTIPRGRAVERSAGDLSTWLTWLGDAAENAITQRSWWVPLSPSQLARAAGDARRFAMAGVEIRSDIFDARPADLPEQGYLASLRHDDAQWFAEFADAPIWDLDLNHLPSFTATPQPSWPRRLILSLHPDRPDVRHIERFRAAIGDLRRHFDAPLPEVMVKYVPQVANFAQLAQFLEFLPDFRQHFAHTTLLPGGSFAGWMRPILARKNATNYLPVGLPHGDDDHPSALNFQNFLPHLVGEFPRSYDALVGDPVVKSQGDFWHRRHNREYEPVPRGYLKIPVPTEDFQRALEMFEELPIRGLSITSPLKRIAAQSCRIANDGDLDALNTARRALGDGPPWRGVDTDEAGMRASLDHLADRGLDIKRAIVFGRGGASQAVIAALKHRSVEIVAHLSSRRGWQPNHAALTDIDLIVNAAGFYGSHNENTPACQAWLDLNYADVNAPPPGVIHLQGDPFFDAQAQAQRQFWRGDEAADN